MTVEINVNKYNMNLLPSNIFAHRFVILSYFVHFGCVPRVIVLFIQTVITSKLSLLIFKYMFCKPEGLRC